MKKKDTGKDAPRAGTTGRVWLQMPTDPGSKEDIYLRASSLAEGTSLSGKRISSLMRDGAVEGRKVEGHWIGTRSALQKYLGSGGKESGAKKGSGARRSR